MQFAGSKGDFVMLVSVDGSEDRNEIRNLTAKAVRKLQKKNATGQVFVDSLGDEEAALEGAVLGSYNWSMKKKRGKGLTLAPELLSPSGQSANLMDIKEGAFAELEARTLANLPANVINPTTFCEQIAKAVKGTDIELRIFEQDEILKMGMQGLHVVGKGSTEKIKLLQMIHRGRANNSNEFDLCLVGKGVTFDSGGISIKPAEDMGDMKADMAGGASVAMATIACARTHLQANIVTLVPLVENMCSGSATRPGDVYTAMNGLTVEVDNTDAEGRIILADTLYYAVTTFAPKSLVDVATLTGAIGSALGDQLYGCFSNSDELWEAIESCSEHTGQPGWRMPLKHHFLKEMKSDIADLRNSGPGKLGGACTAAAFLGEFVGGHKRWAHLDIAGIMKSKSTRGVLAKGMTGSPTRMLIELAKRLSKTTE